MEQLPIPLSSQCLLHTDVHVRIHVDQQTVDVCADLSLALEGAPAAVRLRCRPSLRVQAIVLLDEHTGAGTSCAFTLEEAHAWDVSKVLDPIAFEEATGRETDAWERGNLVVVLPTSDQAPVVVLRITYSCAHQAMWCEGATVCRPASPHDWLLEHASATPSTWNMDVQLEGAAASEWSVLCTNKTSAHEPVVALASLGFYAQHRLVEHTNVLPRLWTSATVPTAEVAMLGRLVTSVADALTKEPLMGTNFVLPQLAVVTGSGLGASCSDALVWDDLVLLDGEQCLFTAAHLDPVYKTLEVLCEALCRHSVERALVAPNLAGRWVVDGVSSWLASRCLAALVGTNERKYRRMRKALTVVRDDGAPVAVWSRPLAWHGHLLGAAELDTPLYRDKALVIFEMLEQRMGEEALVDVVRQLLAPTTTTTTTTTDVCLTHRFEQACTAKADVGAFFNQWVYCNGYPHMRVSFRYSIHSKTTKVRVEQCTQGDEEEGDNYNRLRFTGSLKFRIHELDKTHEQVRGGTCAARSQVLAHFPLSPPPLSPLHARYGFGCSSSPDSQGGTDDDNPIGHQPDEGFGKKSNSRVGSASVSAQRSHAGAMTMRCFYPQVRALPNYDECMVPAMLANDAMLPLTPASVVRTTLPRDQRPARALPCGVAEYEFLCKSRPRRNRKRKRLEEAAIYALSLDRLLTRDNDTSVFYARTDPQLTWFGLVVTHQAPLHVLYQLLQDRELFGQCEAVLACAQQWRIQLQPPPPPPPPAATHSSIHHRTAQGGHGASGFHGDTAVVACNTRRTTNRVYAARHVLARPPHRSARRATLFSCARPGWSLPRVESVVGAID
jgi:hypothetical protein